MIEIAYRDGNLRVMLSDFSSSFPSDDDKENNNRTNPMLKKQSFEEACASFFISKSISSCGFNVAELAGIFGTIKRDMPLESPVRWPIQSSGAHDMELSRRDGKR